MDEFYTINQTATALKVHPLTVRRYIKEGRLKAFKVGGNIRISVDDLRQFTEGFAPNQLRQPRSQVTQTKDFSFSDPIFALKGKGLSMSKLEQE